MSYEGEELYLCKNGHFTRRNCYDSLNIIDNSRSIDVCPVCRADIAWWMQVDQTNDAGVFPELEGHTENQAKTCGCCGHTEVLAPATYCVPDNCGHVFEDVELNVPVVSAKFRVYSFSLDTSLVFDTASKALAFYEAEVIEGDSEGVVISESHR